MTLLFIDDGLFLPFAFRLAREAGKVLFYAPNRKPFPTLADAAIGDGFSEIERVRELYAALDRKPDTIVIPDVGHADLQRHLEKLGFAVWGSGAGDRLEMHRLFLKEYQKKHGMAVPPHEIRRGLDNLWAYLQDEDKWDCYVKISTFRGDMETFHFISPGVSAEWFQQQAVKWGPLSSILTFIIEPKIKAKTELGFDGYCIDGQFPTVAVQGIEGKDKVYIGAVTRYDALPEELRQVNAALMPFLDQNSYRNFFSTEVRVAEDGTPYLIDPCCRHASPAGECQHELIENWLEIVQGGARGMLIEPRFLAKFAVQVMIEHRGDEHGWRSLEVPKDIEQWVKIYFACQTDGVLHIPPFPWSCNLVGSVLGLGDTIEDAMDHLKENVEELEGQDLEINVAALADVLKEIKETEKAGMEFTPQVVPAPETVLDKPA